MNTFGQRTVWHSMLRAASPLVARFPRGVLPSKFENRKPYAPLLVRDDRNEYIYNVENAACGEAIRRAPGGVWLSITATGRDNTNATLEIIPLEEQIVESMEPDSIEAGMWMSICAAQRLYERYLKTFGETMPDVVERLAVSAFIQSERGGWSTPLFEAMETEEVEEAEDTGPEGDGPEPADMVTTEMLTEIAALQAGAMLTDRQRQRLDQDIASGLDIERAGKWIQYLRERQATKAMRKAKR